MTNQEHDPSNVDSAGLAGQADNSQSQGAPISIDEATVKALINHPLVKDAIIEEAKRAGQSVKDRRFAGLEKDVQDLISQLNLTPEQESRYKSISQDRLLQQLSEAVLGDGQNVSTGKVANPPSGNTVDIVGSFQKAGYDINSLSLADIEFAEGFKGSSVELANALLKRRLNPSGGSQQQTPLSQGGQMPVSSGLPVASAGSAAALEADYRARLGKIRPGSVDEVAALKAEFRKKGLDVF
jgi:hypothetical protein